MMLKMDINKPLYICNHILCIVNYQQDGMTSRVLQSYEECPVSYAMLREAYLEHQEIPCMFAYRQCIHYVSSWIFAKRQKKKSKLFVEEKVGLDGSNTWSYIEYVGSPEE